MIKLPGKSLGLVLAFLFVAFASATSQDSPQENNSNTLHSDAPRVNKNVMMEKAVRILRSGDYEKAEHGFRNLLTHYPEFASAHYNLGCSLALQGKKQHAIESLARSLETGFVEMIWYEHDEFSKRKGKNMFLPHGMHDDPDLSSLREMQGFKTILSEVRRRVEEVVGDTIPGNLRLAEDYSIIEDWNACREKLERAVELGADATAEIWHGTYGGYMFVPTFLLRDHIGKEKLDLLYHSAAMNGIHQSPLSPRSHYELARSLMMLEKREQALKSLRNAIALGWAKFSELSNDRVWKDVLTNEERTMMRSAASPPRPSLFAHSGHRGTLISAIMSSNGQLIVTLGGDGSVRLWDVKTNKEIRRLMDLGELHAGSFYDDSSGMSLTRISPTANIVDLSLDGRVLVAAGSDGSARVWDPATGQLKHILHGHSDKIRNAVISLNSKMLLTAGNEGTVILWDLDSGTRLGSFSKFSPGGSAKVAFSHDSNKFIIGDWSGNRIELYDAKTGKVLHQLKGSKGSLSTVQFSPSGELVLAAASDGRILIWDCQTGTVVKTLEHEQRVESAGFSADGKFVISASTVKPDADKQAVVCLWEVLSGREIRRFSSNSKSIAQIEMSPNGRLVLARSKDGILRVWDAMSGIERYQLTRIREARFADKGESILVAEGNMARLIETKTGEEISRFQGQAVPIYSALFSKTGRYLMTLVDRKYAQVWDLKTGAPRRRLEGHSDYISSLSHSPDEEVLLTASKDETARMWNLSSGKQVKVFQEDSEILLASFSLDAQTVLTASKTGTAHVWDSVTGQEKEQFRVTDGSYEYLESLHLSPNRSLLLTTGDPTALWDTSSGSLVQRLESQKHHLHTHPTYWGEFSSDGSLVSTLSTAGDLRVWDLASGKVALSFVNAQTRFGTSAFAPDAKTIVTACEDGSARLWSVESDKQIRRFDSRLITDRRSPQYFTEYALFSPEGDLIFTKAFSDRKAYIWEKATGKLRNRIEISAERLSGVSFSPKGRFVVLTGSDGVPVLWDLQSGTLRGYFYAFRNGSWAFVASDGRFDTDSLEDVQSLYWMVADSPYQPLPLDIFMRDYYEPRLLARILQGEEMPKLRDVSSLNRVQPKIQKIEVESDDAEDLVRISVTVSGASGKFQHGKEEVTIETGVYDLRLFRDGQLVGQWPDTAAEAALPTTAQSDVDLNKWRESTKICDSDELVTKTFIVRLPRNRAGEQIELSAYAFNHDRVKSSTAKTYYMIPNDLKIVKSRAFLITVGVNEYQGNIVNNLEFAVADARIVWNAMEPLLKNQKYEVISMPLTSTSEMHVDEALATKGNIQAVLDLLSGRPVNEKVMKQLPHSELLRPARPDDLVLIFFSSHGYTDSNEGIYYFFPRDIGEDHTKVSSELLKRCISSEEMSYWLRNVDAGELVLIVDTCHAAATVDQPGFKPGPMGSRGLGQLAYDKGMRILAASQADDVAIESNKIKQGLLTYALVRDGLDQQRAVQEGRITLGSWLRYAEQRVPTLYDEVLRGEIKDAKETVDKQVMPILPDEKRERTVQRPTLFDYGRNRSIVTLLSNE